MAKQDTHERAKRLSNKRYLKELAKLQRDTGYVRPPVGEQTFVPEVF
ncbi:MAG: hypothetical protein OSB03_12410 [Vicinamibacterales bacterium]|jgi:hypothetical protein|nr:hypothetical protein [Vicinamibacterales bacterium]